MTRQLPLIALSLASGLAMISASYASEPHPNPGQCVADYIAYCNEKHEGKDWGDKGYKACIYRNVNGCNGDAKFSDSDLDKIMPAPGTKPTMSTIDLSKIQLPSSR